MTERWTICGAWLFQEQNKVLGAILHTDDTTMAWGFGFRQLIFPGHFVGIAGMPYDHARNQACVYALNGPYKYLFFLDSDVIPPRDAVLRLLAHDLPIVSGVYCRRSPPHAVPVMQDAGGWVINLPASGLKEVNVVGAGCLLIRRDVLEHFVREPQRPGKPFFDWRVDLTGIPNTEPNMSEDFTFCWAAKARGYKVMVDCSVRCKHVGYFQCDYGSAVPLDTTGAA